MTTQNPPSLLQHLWKTELIAGLIAVVLGAAVLA